MRIKYIIYSVLFALLLGSCSKEDIEIKGPAKRTVLAYMIASTNLGSDIRANIRQMMTVASNKALNRGNLVVYYSENKRRQEREYSNRHRPFLRKPKCYPAGNYV